MWSDAKKCYLPFFQSLPAPAADSLTLAKSELKSGTEALHAPECRLEYLPDAKDGFEILKQSDHYLIRGGKTGILYGVYRFLMNCAAMEEITVPYTTPAFSLRMLNHWDNMDGTVERGYAGNSFFFKDGAFAWKEERLLEYGRLLAAVGINAVCLNNVNVRYPADRLCTEKLLPKVKRIADLLRPFGIRLILAIDYALPVTLGLPTADPLDESVQGFWKRQVDLIYSFVPDLAGFLVKADSEFRPGPYLYHRDHAEGANMLARALKPHNGVLLWRCFVYNCRQDWRDHTIDRPKAAYENYQWLDGRFDDNVILQIKNGPYDFQVREPVSPLLMAMPRTKKALEIQLAQEYTGQQVDLYFMPPMWREIMEDLSELPPYIAAVSNMGNDDNWTGHDLAQANLYAYGCLAWEGRKMDVGKTARKWIALTFGPVFPGSETLFSMLLTSRHTYEKYTSPLGLCWMVNPSVHYGPSPEGYEFSAWGTYTRANFQAVGIDRTERGTGYTAQYPQPLRSQYNDPVECPEEMLLFFHRLPYSFRMKDGRTLLQRIYDDHFEGAQEAEKLLQDWESLECYLPRESFEKTRERFRRQVQNAREWRDVVNTYFYRFTGIPDAHGRRIYE